MTKLKDFLAGLGIPEDLPRQILEVHEREVNLALLKNQSRDARVIPTSTDCPLSPPSDEHS